MSHGHEIHYPGCFCAGCNSGSSSTPADLAGDDVLTAMITVQPGVSTSPLLAALFVPNMPSAELTVTGTPGAGTSRTARLSWRRTRGPLVREFEVPDGLYRSDLAAAAMRSQNS